ncbi:hypothetical protein BG28_07685 [Nesterenkonia sp. AN1]|uniref:Uncharacterized protein n=1 Tax=Nesterenkonia aurantiaca TaxID=1436010 RepID=A0A4R7G5Q3_9MICC|nr:hypothetical protein [Nesterenkonia]EXF24223.1 hypothetical protein BG28_07685 [Nesterenkonia sp. AN1]TDS86570.1 hypothetical protein EV640_103261 [Nesterenkonia aurantiaca]
MNTTSKRQKAGLVLAGVYSATSIPSVLFPVSEGEVGPPIGILVIGSVLGLVGLVAVIVAWRTGSRAALRVAAGAVIIVTLTGLPAFFVDVSAGVKLLVGVSVLFTIAAVVLVFSPERRPTPVLD